MSSSAHLNDIEKDLLQSFQKAALGMRCSTQHFFSPDFDKGFGNVQWLEAMPLGTKGWVILSKQVNPQSLRSVEQFVLKQDLGFYDAIYEMAAFEKHCEGSGMPKAIAGADMILPKASAYYRDVAIKNGLIFNSEGLPHPTFNGQIVGNESFDDSSYEIALKAYADRPKDTLAQRTTFINYRPIDSETHLFHEIEGIEKAFNLLELAKEMGRYKRCDIGDDYRGIAKGTWLSLVDRFKIDKGTEALTQKHYKKHFAGFFDGVNPKAEYYYSNFAYALSLAAMDIAENALAKSVLRADSQTAETILQAMHLFHFYGLLQIAHLKYSWSKDHKALFEEEFKTYKDLAAKKYCDITGVSDIAKAEQYVEAECMNNYNKLVDKPIAGKTDEVKKYLKNVITELKEIQAGRLKAVASRRLQALPVPHGYQRPSF